MVIMVGELRTVNADGTVDSKPIGVDIFRTEEGRQLLDSWKQQSDAWEDYCRKKKNVV